MKSQDLVLLLKLISLAHREQSKNLYLLKSNTAVPDDWRGWEPIPAAENPIEEPYSLRSLEAATGISRSEISAALRRCSSIGLLRPAGKSGLPKVNTRSLLDFIVYGLKYVFPAHVGALGRGIPTGASAPVLAGQLLSAGDQVFVWEDPLGSTKGQCVEPLFKTVPFAVRKDSYLYAMLALIDSIRLGRERESAISRKLLEKYFGTGSSND